MRRSLPREFPEPGSSSSTRPRTCHISSNRKPSLRQCAIFWRGERYVSETVEELHIDEMPIPRAVLVISTRPEERSFVGKLTRQRAGQRRQACHGYVFDRIGRRHSTGNIHRPLDQI